MSQLGKSYEIARRRLLSTEKKLKNDNLKVEYVKIIQERESLGYISKKNWIMDKSSLRLHI